MQIHSVPEPSSFRGNFFSDSTPFHIRFHDVKARQYFLGNFSECRIHLEHQSYWTSLILLYPLSFIVGVRSLFARSRWVVPPWSYKSFTPICMDSIILYLVSSLLFEVSVSSHSGAYLWCATCPKGITSWLPQLSSSADCVQRRTLVSLLWDTFILGWLSKYPLLGLCKRSKVP